MSMCSGTGLALGKWAGGVKVFGRAEILFNESFREIDLNILIFEEEGCRVASSTGTNAKNIFINQGLRFMIYARDIISIYSSDRVLLFVKV